jgi:ubiquitin C-terminal hydrolase
VSDAARSAFRPLLVKKVVAESAPQFSGSRQHDAQELLVMLLDAMHEELNSRKGAGYAALKDAPELSDAVLSKRWWDNYARANESCLKDLFVGQIHSRVTCTSCRCTSSTFDPFWSLSVPLPPAARETTLEACLALFTRLETLTGENRYFCQKCRAARDSTKQLALYRCPRLLVLHAKRFSAREDQPGHVFDKLGHAVTPTTDALNLRPFCAPSAHLDANGRPGTLLYDLVAVTNHHGESGTHGHYTADCYNPLTDTWLTYDDSNVHPTKHIDPHAAYLFFYVRRDSS